MTHSAPISQPPIKRGLFVIQLGDAAPPPFLTLHLPPYQCDDAERTAWERLPAAAKVEGRKAYATVDADALALRDKFADAQAELDVIADNDESRVEGDPSNGTIQPIPMCEHRDDSTWNETRFALSRWDRYSWLVRWEGPDPAVDFAGFKLSWRAARHSDVVPKGWTQEGLQRLPLLSNDVIRQRRSAKLLGDPVAELRRVRSAPAVSWLVPGFLATGELTLTHGLHKDGKTSYAIRVAARLVATSAARVLYLALEDYDNVLRRFDHALRAEGLSADDVESMFGDRRIVIHNCAGFDLRADDVDSMVAASVIEAVRPDLVVVDNVSAGLGPDADLTRDPTPFVRTVDAIRIRLPATYWILHHSNSAGGVSGLQAIQRLPFAVTRLTATTHKRELVRAGGDTSADLGRHRIISAPSDESLPLAVLGGPEPDKKTVPVPSATAEESSTVPTAQEGPADHAPQPVVSESEVSGYRAAVAVALPPATAALQADPAADVGPVIDSALADAGIVAPNNDALRQWRRRIRAAALASVQDKSVTRERDKGA
jgi:hypothetical protein